MNWQHKGLTVELSAIACRKYNAWVLWITVRAIGGYSIWKHAACDAEAAVVVVLRRGFIGGSHHESKSNDQCSTRDCVWADLKSVASNLVSNAGVDHRRHKVLSRSDKLFPPALL